MSLLWKSENPQNCLGFSSSLFVFKTSQRWKQASTLHLDATTDFSNSRINLSPHFLYTERIAFISSAEMPLLCNLLRHPPNTHAKKVSVINTTLSETGIRKRTVFDGNTHPVKRCMIKCKKRKKRHYLGNSSLHTDFYNTQNILEYFPWFL